MYFDKYFCTLLLNFYGVPVNHKKNNQQTALLTDRTFLILYQNYCILKLKFIGLIICKSIGVILRKFKNVN